MSQPGFPQRPGFPQQPVWRPQLRVQQAPQPHHFPPRGWQAPPSPRRKRSPRPFLTLVIIALVATFAYSFLSEDSEDQVATEYRNESYTVPSPESGAPSIPVPEYESDVAAWLQSNSLYEQQLASPVRCDLDPVEPQLSTDALQTRMRAFVSCLTRVWGPALESAGHIAYQPTLYVYPMGGEVTTSCGTQGSLNAFYCGADQNLYLAADVVQILPRAEATSPQAYDLIVAHEYGHAVQGRSGVFTASFYASEDAGSESGAREISRRVELQADCFAGAAIDSVSESMGLGDIEREAVARISFEIGDDRLADRFDAEIEDGDHGVGENRRSWATRGLAGGPLSNCNAFIAQSDEVR